MTQKFDYVVLGAGKPHSGDTPTILTNVTKDQILVEWILAAFDIPLEDITFISGYESDLVSAQYPAMNCIENEIWGTTKTLYSLSLGLSSKTNTNAVIVSYSDIVIKKKSIDLMKECAAPIVLLVEENGSLDYTTKTVPKPFEWVATCDSQLKKIGYNLLPCERTGRFVGCVKFSNETVNLIKQIISELDFETIASMHLTEMIEILRCRGLETRVIDVSGDWTEIRQDGDIARFMLGTKADTLLNLMPVLKSSVILDQVTFSIKNWQADSIAILESIESNLIKHKNSRLIVRSSSQAEDTFASSNAGSFESILGVRPGVELQEAIEKVISSYETTSNVDQILVQPMLQGVTLSGVAFTRSLRNKAPYYVINYELTNKTDTITSGVSTEHQTLYVFRDGILSEAIESKFSALLAAIQEIEQVLNYDCLDIEFAIADETIYLFQVRPLSDGISTAKIKDTEYANIIEQAKNLWDDLYFASPFVPGDSKI